MNRPDGEDLPEAGSAFPAWALPAYVVVVAYGTLYPVGGWHVPPDFRWSNLLLTWPEGFSSTDLLTNLLIYLPVGAFWLWRSPRRHLGISILAATLAGAGLSYVLECLQILLPRVPSRLDLVVNTLGSLAGGVGAAMTGRHSIIGTKLWALRSKWFERGRLPNMCLLALALWMLSQLAPLVPSLDLGNLKDGIRPLWNSLRGGSGFDALHAVEYLLSVLGLGLMAATAARARVAAASLWSASVCVVLAAKVPIMTRELSLEAIVGSGAALVLLPLALMVVPLRVGATSLILGSVLVHGLRPEMGIARDVVFQPITWIPLARHRLNLFDFIDLIGGLWPFVALAYLSWLLLGRRRSAAAAVVGGATVAAMVLGIELAQQRIPGRIADVTDVFVAMAGWCSAWLIMAEHSHRR